MTLPPAAPARYRSLTLEDRPAWERIWRANLVHFRADESATLAIDETWRRLIDPREPLQGWLVRLDDLPAGLIHVVLRYHTFSARPVAVLEDLWIEPVARRKGLAGEAIALLIREGRDLDWRRIEWETDADNLAAQQLYDRSAEPVAVRRYRIDLA
jgi:RimJ/RimL family protein N-acetyltransferase